jgi:hypothetical protein
LTTKDDKPVGRFAELLIEAAIEPYVLTEDITLDPPTRKQMQQMVKATTEEEADKALFGDKYDAVVGLFEERSFALWNAFVKDFRVHMFGRGADDVEGKSPA